MFAPFVFSAADPEVELADRLRGPSSKTVRRVHHIGCSQYADDSLRVLRTKWTRQGLEDRSVRSVNESSGHLSDPYERSLARASRKTFHVISRAVA